MNIVVNETLIFPSHKKRLDVMNTISLLLWVQESDISRKFYKKLGFDVVVADDDHSIVKLDNLEITLVNMRDEPGFAKDSLGADKGRGVYLYIRVGNVDDKYQSLQNAGFVPYTHPRNWPWGNREFILKDPDGYKICFWSPINT